ncbi:hypothetical protein EYF80_065457 [Liparis tanakae]|uniref:Uncharacterized protein n=1 Tax=Liparis tanakae TaxID=230148 RepID=A0A4Z2E6N5_9TELE|nr:hypothetical protein EYF80_065457 [Liparis tanakae]
MRLPSTLIFTAWPGFVRRRMSAKRRICLSTRVTPFFIGPCCRETGSAALGAGLQPSAYKTESRETRRPNPTATGHVVSSYTVSIDEPLRR